MSYAMEQIIRAFSSLPHFNHALKDKHLQTIYNVLNGYSTVFLSTVYGKSLCFLAPPLIMDKVRLLCMNKLFLNCNGYTVKSTNNCFFFFMIVTPRK